MLQARAHYQSRSIATRAAHKHRRILAHLDKGVRTRIRGTLTLVELKLLQDAANSLDDTFGSSSNGSGCCKRSFAVDFGVLCQRIGTLVLKVVTVTGHSYRVEANELGLISRSNLECHGEP